MVDDQGRLQGLVSRTDVLRALAQPPVAELPRENPPPGHHARAGEMMMTGVPQVKAEATLAEVIDRLVGHARRRVMVASATDIVKERGSRQILDHNFKNKKFTQAKTSRDSDILESICAILKIS